MCRSVCRACLVLIAALVAAMDSTATFANDGYFLSWDQKLELICHGQITDENKVVYDIWVCPGYTYPASLAGTHWDNAMCSYGEYFKSSKYSRLIDRSSDALEWGWNDCLVEYAAQGSAKAWGKHFGDASDRVSRGVFGWPLAYPVAFGMSLGESVFRFASGFIGLSLGTVVGGVGIPVYYSLDSGTSGTFEALVPGTIFPMLGWTWNTICSPPMALAGRKPSPERADGFWVIMSEPRAKSYTFTPDPDILEQLVELVGKAAEIEREHAEQFNSAVQELDREIFRLNELRKTKIEQLKTTKNSSIEKLALEVSLQPTGNQNRFSDRDFRPYMQEISIELQQQGHLKSNIDKAMNEISDHLDRVPNRRSENEKIFTP